MSEDRKAKRVQFDFSPETWDIVEQLKDSTGSNTRAEVIRRAIALYAWFNSEIKPDNVVDVKTKEGELIYRMTGKFFQF